MKLRNKKTGEIVEVKSVRFYCQNEDGYEYRWSKRKEFDGITIAELNEEWEDYEEPKEFWYIGQDGVIFSDTDTITQDYADRLEAIGNYFETREEAEKAVEKLKAWKRLRNNGFKFSCYMRRSDWAGLPEVKALENLIDITAYLPKRKIKEVEADLNLLFGGEK